MQDKVARHAVPECFCNLMWLQLTQAGGKKKKKKKDAWNVSQHCFKIKLFIKYTKEQH